MKEGKSDSRQTRMGKTFLIEPVSDNDAELYQSVAVQHQGDAGLDLYVSRDIVIPAHQTVLVDMGIRVQCRSFDWCCWHWLRGKIYKYHSYMLFPRSSIYKTPLVMHNSIGLIDSAYLGNIKAPLHNTSSKPVALQRGERYVQLVNSDLAPIDVKVLPSTHSQLLDRATSRGQGGFGSTGN